MKKWMWNVMIILFAIAFLGSGFVLVRYYWDAHTQEKAYDELAQIMADAMQEAPQPQEGEPPSLITVTDEKTHGSVEILPEYQALYELNSDIVGWIKIPGAGVDYPVMQTPNAPSYYLNHNFYKEKNNHGAIYVEENCDIQKPSDNLIIYGHHMRDGSMFGSLDRYKKKSFWQENPTITFNTLKQHHEYEIFAVFLTTASAGKGFAYHSFINAQDQADFERFVAQCQKLSLYKTDITPQYGDKLITLSTCEYSQNNGRFVVVARRID